MRQWARVFRCRSDRMIMTGLAMLAITVDRRATALRLVMLSAGIGMLIEPDATMGPSFQMSFRSDDYDGVGDARDYRRSPCHSAATGDAVGRHRHADRAGCDNGPEFSDVVQIG